MSSPRRSKKIQPTRQSFGQFAISRKTIRIVTVFFVVFALLYVVLPELGSFNNTYHFIRHALPGELILALSAAGATYLAAGLTYWLLALHSLPYARTVLIQVTSSFANRILPAGTGGLALNIQYLRKSGHSTAEAGVVAAVNNVLGFVAGMLLLLIVLTLGISTHVRVHAPQLKLMTVLVALIAVVFVGGLIIIAASSRIQVRRWFRPAMRSLIAYKKRPSQLLLGVGSSAFTSLAYAAVLYFTAHAIGTNITFGQAILVMLVSTFGTVIIPTPGGIGGAEAGVVSALLAIGISSPEALATALLYRVFTFWVPLLVGGLTLRPALRYLT